MGGHPREPQHVLAIIDQLPSTVPCGIGLGRAYGRIDEGYLEKAICPPQAGDKMTGSID